MKPLKMRAYVLGLALAMLALWVTGCGSMCPTLYPKQCGKTTPEVVLVTDYEKPTKLPVPDEPEWKLEGVTEPAEWRVWAEALGVDFGRCMDWSLEAVGVLKKWNAAVDSMPDDS